MCLIWSAALFIKFLTYYSNKKEKVLLLFLNSVAFTLPLFFFEKHTVMQFGGQHPGGLGVPAVGMALPGYVAQPQLGFGNSEMTW